MSFKLTDEYCLGIRQTGYLGQKGFTILKSQLHPKDLEEIKKDLFKIPMMNGKPQTELGFPIYRENERKIYLPRFYAHQRYRGQPAKSELDPLGGTTIQCTFQGQLQPHQVEAIDKYLAHIVSCYAGGILELPCGYGKTVLAIKLIAELGKKTMILVHKEFLMNQWIERIRQFMPTARVGILQGKKCEIDQVDICIGMIQSIYNKEFPPNTFLSFGFTIIDEVHRIGSTEFSGVLSRIVTPRMLGISATVDRKDRLTDILYHFMGPKIHSVCRRQDDKVQVRAIEFISHDEEFKTVETDYRGQTKYSTMISKLCAFAPRSDFIVRVILDQYAENPGKQMIVLCHNRCLLNYLHQVLHTKKEPTVGYYVGGMKQSQLELSESKQVVLATYAMASEALDIKTLSTLLLITPKTDIVQSVGRILRTKHNDPRIIDIVDCHPCFQNQWIKRRQYYKQCHYDIVKTNNQKYPNGWKNMNQKEEQETGHCYNIDDSIHLMDDI